MMNEKLQIALKKADEQMIVKDVIGTKQEKILHKTIKFLISLDDTNHEIKIGKMFADVKLDNHIYEVQTRNFNTLRGKLEYFLKDFQVTVVYPVALTKTLYYLDEMGEFISTRKSPKKSTPFEIGVELYRIKDWLNNPNLSFQILMFKVDEYRMPVSKKHFRSKGYVRTNQIPQTLEEEINLNNKEDWYKLLEEKQIPHEFTVKQFVKCTKLSSKKASTMVNVLAAMDIIRLSGKEGRANKWQY